MNTIQIAKIFMKLRETYPISPDKRIGGLQEIFDHNIFLQASESKKKEIIFRSSNAKYKDELKYSWDHYFGIDLSTFLKNMVVLDLGCFNGGRSMAWFERYNLEKLFGIDVKKEYIDAAKNFANKKKINAEFIVGKGEDLPFEDTKFDAILSFDVLEHVQNVQKTLDQCWRVLKPKGKLFAVFPSYFHPTEHHLSLVTRTPFIHYFFSRRTLIKAYCEILEERGRNAYWYKRYSSKPKSWERCNTINGITYARFKQLIKERKWKICLNSRKTIGSVGRKIYQRKFPLLISHIFFPFTFIPGMQEIFLHRISFILEKN